MSEAIYCANHQTSSPRPKEPVISLLQHTTSSKLQPTQTVWRSACNQIPQYNLHSQALAHFCAFFLVDKQVMDQFTQNEPCCHHFSGKSRRQNSLLQLEVEALEDKDFQTLRNGAVKLPSSIQSMAETATETSTSCMGIHLNHPRDSDASNPGHPNHPAEPSGNQRTVSAI